MGLVEMPPLLKLAFRPDPRFLLGLSALLLAGLFAGQNVATWPVRLRYPGEEQHVEGIPLAEAMQLRQGVPIYSPPSPERFAAANHGPLYYLLGARLIDPEAPTYIPLRLVSLLGALGCAVGCALLAYWLGRSYFAAALAPLVFLACGLVTRPGLSARSDIFAVFLFFAGFLVANRCQHSRALFLAVPLMLLGFFYKQQFVAGPLAVLLFLLLEKRYRVAVEFVGLLALGGLAMLAFFRFVAFPGQAFLLHFLFYNLWPFRWNQFAVGVLTFAQALLLPFLMGLAFLRSHHDKLLNCYAGCAVLLGLVTFGKTGSGASYFLECVVVFSSLAAVLFTAKLVEPLRSAQLLCVLGIAFLLGLAFKPAIPGPEDFARDRAVQDYLRRNFSPRTPALGYYTGDLVRAGLETPITDLYAYGQLIRLNMLPERDLMTQFYQRRFGVIVTYFDLRRAEVASRADFSLTESLRRAILLNYHLAATLDLPGPEKLLSSDRFYAWVPRPR